MHLTMIQQTMEMTIIAILFFKTVFDDSMDSEYDVKLMIGDFNVAPNHKMDLMGY